MIIFFSQQFFRKTHRPDAPTITRWRASKGTSSRSLTRWTGNGAMKSIPGSRCSRGGRRNNRFLRPTRRPWIHWPTPPSWTEWSPSGWTTSPRASTYGWGSWTRSTRRPPGRWVPPCLSGSCRSSGWVRPVWLRY